MKRSWWFFLKYSVLLSLLILLALIFLPRQYKGLAFEERQGTLYWQLSTGSTIGYQKLSGSGDPNRSPIVYLHGGPGAMVSDEIIAFLRPLAENGYDIYLYDQIGGGHSARLEDIREYSADRHKKDLAEIIDTIKAETVILMGQSWGAMLAMLYLSDHPDRVEKMIFTGPGPILPIKHTLAKMPAPDSLDLREPQFSNREGNQKAYDLRSRFIHYCATKFGKKLGSDREADRFFTHLNTELKKSTSCDGKNISPAKGGGGFYAHIMTAKSFSEVKDTRSKIKGLKTPLLILKGQCDNQPWGYTQEYLNLLPYSQFEIIENGGHVISEEDGERYLKSILSFLQTD